MVLEAFSWKNEMKKAERKLAENIKNYERNGLGNKAAQSKETLLSLKKRISETFA